jgi:2-polyprenyl-6-methoxyphenol hydroxylase-like FAD-dependent oxidoreductase
VADHRVVVIGAGVAGMSAALLLARRGCRVTLIERDGLDIGRPDQAPLWTRRGIPHFLQPHAFIPRGRLEMKTHLPDVYDALLDAGAAEVDLRRKLPGDPLPEDEALQYLAVRRPVIEWALRRAVGAEPGIVTRANVRVRAIATDGGRVAGVRGDDGEHPADLVVDAHGRHAARAGGLLAHAAAPATSSCGVVYYSRYYRCRPGFELPDGPWFLSPRADLGYLAYASFPGDNGTFAALFAVPPNRPEWRVLAETSAFEAAVATIPALRGWVDPAGVDPITEVLPMAGLQNVLVPDPAPLPGLVAVGDAYCHTDPTLAHGLAFGLIHAAALADAVEQESGDIGAAYRAATYPEVRERFDWSSALDVQRLRMWLGQPLDFTHHDGDYALFSLAASGAVARVDPTVFRIFNRRIGLLDRTAVLDDDIALRRRIEQRFAALRAGPAPMQGPGRDELLAVLGRA